MSNPSDFIIENGVLTKYKGPGGDVVIPDSVTSIGDRAFYWCSGLTSVEIPGSVTSIGNGVFYWCSNLTSATIPDSVTSIGDRAFWGCGCLTSVTIPDGVTSIGKEAFSWCSILTSVTIPEGVTSIGDHAFSGCGSLTSVTIPDSVTSIGNGAFYGCSGLADADGFVIVKGCLYNYTGPGGNVVIPDGVTSIGDKAFEYCGKMTSIEIPESVTSIGNEVFYRCTALKRITMHSPAFDAVLAMKDSDLKTSVLVQHVWRALEPRWQAACFLSHQSKSLTKTYLECCSDEILAPMGEAILERLQGKTSVKECNGAAAFMGLFGAKLPVDLVKRLYEALQAQKNGKKAVETVKANAELQALLAQYDPASEANDGADPFVALMLQSKMTAKEAETRAKRDYALTPDELPPLTGVNGETVSPSVAVWLLTVHDEIEDNRSIRSSTPGLRPEAAAIVELLDPESLQSALLTLGDTYLVKYQNTKKKWLSLPICRYADEATMEELTKRAPKWATAVSGNDAPPLWEFRKAVIYSNTRAAMLFAERYGELDEYAKLRGMTEDELRDKYLSDVGLDEQGGKVYDLGSQTVTARLQKDLSFLFELPSGKTAKSLPKKGADPAKYEAAKADFDEMRKAVKKILKSRGAVLFGDFLSGRERESAAWQEAYLKNPLLRMAAGLVVWDQGGKSFTLTDAGAIDADGQPYTVGETPIKLAHPMEMDADTVQAWQRYFNARGLKQPFAQVWEPAIDPNTIKEGRYKDCLIPYYRFTGQTKHGINVGDWDFHNEISISFKGCDATVERIDWERHQIDPNHRFEVTSFKFKKYDRQVNHIVGYLDRVTVWDRVRKDDVTVMEWMERFTLAQVAEFIAAAQEAGAVNVLALLLEYKNAHFADFDPMDEFTLEW